MSTDIRTCWKEIGVWGDASCEKLEEHIHCRNCPVFAAAGQSLLDRPAPDHYLAEWADDLARVKEQQRTGDQSVFVFRLGDEYFGLPVRRIVEIMDPQPIRKIPHRKSPLLKGLVSIRGQLQLYISLHDLLGVTRAAAAAPGTRARMCIFEQDGQHWVFTIDECIGIHRYAAEDVQPLPTTLDKAAGKYSEGVLRQDDARTVGLLDVATMINHISKSIRK
ncbi:MAG: purine-binding chemotaxis protein CheW [Spartobacteria bacterium]|nr:purine-binding chemotaxis protein CheW [Spartobacteria bacterium]